MSRTGYIQPYTSDASYKKVFDADFQETMSTLGFKLTPREHFTLNDMERHHKKMQLEGRDY